MSSVWFYYGAMGSGKTIDAIRTAYNYEERKLIPLCLSPSTDTVGGTYYKGSFLMTKWHSRIGLEREAYVIRGMSSIKSFVDELMGMYKIFDVIIVDEVQFLLKEQVEELFEIAHIWGIPVIAYGLMTTFKTTLFEGSKRLVELGAKLKEIKGIGTDGKKVVINAMIVDGEIVTDGDDIQIGQKQYVPLSYREYYRKVLRKRD